MKHGVLTRQPDTSPLSGPGANAHSSQPWLVPLPADESQTRFQHARLSSTDDTSYQTSRAYGEAFTDSPFEVPGNIKTSSCTSPTTCTS